MVVVDPVVVDPVVVVDPPPDADAIDEEAEGGEDPRDAVEEADDAEEEDPRDAVVVSVVVSVVVVGEDPRDAVEEADDAEEEDPRDGAFRRCARRSAI